MSEKRAAYNGKVPMTELEQLNDTLDKLFEILLEVADGKVIEGRQELKESLAERGIHLEVA